MALYTSVLGLALYGYNIMRVLGNKLTLHSPSRGFCMELGAAITVLLASQYGLPVSSTMCITGATIGVALCNGDSECLFIFPFFPPEDPLEENEQLTIPPFLLLSSVKSFNWRGLAWIVSGWILTVPAVGTMAGCLCAVVLYAPNW